jgi:TolB-like protein/DNA-binding winged helix-turn-helix (wHTH) protein/Flp pilus assembly protein TadD
MTPDSPLAFDDVVIDFAARRVVRGGVEQPLEPKAFAVLALLAGTPGRAFGRDELLDAVWGHRHVTPGVLNRVMTLLRHALGEDAHTPRHLHTLHGVGYRFDLPATASPPLALPEGEAAVVPQRRANDLAPAAVAVAPIRRWPWVAAALLLVLGLAVGWWFQEKRRLDSPPTLIVMPLRPIGEDGGIAAGLSDELITALARIDGLRVIARESTTLAAGQSATQRVRQLGISHVLEGSLQRVGEHLRVNLRLSDARDGRMLWAQDYDRDAADVLGLQREIAQGVAAALSLRLGLVPRPVGRSGDADYYRRYLAANALLEQREGNQIEATEQAEADFRSLLRERPADARAHAGLAAALTRRAYRRPQLAARLREEANAEALTAMRLDPGLADPYRVLAGAACRVNRWHDCLLLYARARDLAPSSALTTFQYAMALATLGYLDRATAVMEEAAARDPLNAGSQFALGRLLDTQGRHAEARDHLDRGDEFSTYGRWFNAVWRGHPEEALQVAQRMGVGPNATIYDQQLRPAYIATARALLDPSQWPQARVAMARTEAASGLMNFLRVFDPQERPAQLIADLDVVRQRSYSSWDLLLWTRDLAWLRRDPAFQDYLQRNGLLAYWRAEGFPAQCRESQGRVQCD